MEVSVLVVENGEGYLYTIDEDIFQGSLVAENGKEMYEKYRELVEKIKEYGDFVKKVNMKELLIVPFLMIYSGEK